MLLRLTNGLFDARVEVVKSAIRTSRDVVVADMSANTTSRAPRRFGDLADISAKPRLGLL